MKRKDFSSIESIALSIRSPRNTGADDIEGEAYRLNRVLLYRRDNGLIVAVVDRDDLFDVNGNRFNHG
jgi:hypothetical protein